MLACKLDLHYKIKSHLERAVNCNILFTYSEFYIFKIETSDYNKCETITGIRLALHKENIVASSTLMAVNPNLAPR